MHPRTAKPKSWLQCMVLNERLPMKKLLTGLLFALVLTGCRSTLNMAPNSATPQTPTSTGADTGTGSYAKAGLLMRATMEDSTDFTDKTYFIDYQLVSGYTVAAVTIVYWECSQGLFSASC